MGETRKPRLELDELLEILEEDREVSMLDCSTVEDNLILDRFLPPRVENNSKFGHILRPEAHGHDGSLVTSFPELIATAELPIQEVSVAISGRDL